MKKLYQVASKTDSRKIAEFLSRDGQLLLPFLDMIRNTEQAVDELIDLAGKAAIEAVLLVSAEQVAGPKQPGKAKRDVNWHGWQAGGPGWCHWPNASRGSRSRVFVGRAKATARKWRFRATWCGL